jgi:hypothetical protein
MKTWPILLFSLLPLPAIAAAPRAGAARPPQASFRSLQQAPADTAEAHRVRIWLGIERTSSCRVTVDIADSAGTVVRHLLSRLLNSGFYNIYWDKRDDSGRYAPPGSYVVHINDCGQESTGEITAVYRPFENLTELSVDAAKSPAQISISLAADAVGVTLKIFTMADNEVATVARDTLLKEGTHALLLTVDNPISRGRYLLRLYINERFVRETEFTYTKP